MNSQFPQVRVGHFVFAVVFVLSAISTSSHAQNLLEVESKWVETGSTDVKLGIYIKNSHALEAVLIPLEIRSIHVGSFIRRSLAIRPEARFMEWAGDEQPYTVTNFYPYRSLPVSGDDCTTDSAGKVWRWLPHDSLPDFMGEEALLYFFTSTTTTNYQLLPGDDGTSGSGTPSISLEFDVTDVGGAFIIDTTCTVPANHLTFVGANYTEIVPQFRPAIVLIGCNAECHGDPNCDGQCDLIDLVTTLSVAFKGALPVIDPDPRCPTENTDVNCDMVTDVIDIIRMVNVQYRSASVNAEFCAPCEHIPRTGNPKDDVQTPYFRNRGTL